MASSDTPQSQPPLPPPEERMAHFVKGAELVLSNWQVLQMCVENGWGGRNGNVKADALLEAVLQMFKIAFDSNAEVYKDDLEVLLSERLMEDFKTEADDGSIPQTAGIFVRMFKEICKEGSFTNLNILETRLRDRGVKSLFHLGPAPRQLRDDSESDSESDGEDPRTGGAPDGGGDAEWTTVTRKKNR
eukprot:gnl/Hemi2/26181_TR8786_c0_g1_i2.p1 gnl/Hemi2/26181_TR8786_c0_g1~~gnl/Hemi2/26181_TR8786_c0_g1_i2.p1  ORF type:complete len:208 (+),score=29.51 gnl/Hemi2/26181_TR8786_c0_g1_i2:61-624(+)